MFALVTIRLLCTHGCPDIADSPIVSLSRYALSCHHISAVVQEVRLAGSFVRFVGESVIDGFVYGVAASTELLAASTDSGTARVWLFGMDSGACIRTLGNPGPEEGMLGTCHGLRFTLDGARVAIAEQINNRLSLFTVANGLARCVAPGGLKAPADVDFTPNGETLVADCDNNRVCVYSADCSSLLRTIDTFGDESPLSAPVALASHGGTVFVLARDSGRVHLFT